MKVLVTGGAGYLGSVLVRKLLKKGFKVKVLDILMYGVHSIEEIINDMKLEHEGRPHGVPDSYDWAFNPRIGTVSPPSGWSAVMAWGCLYEWIDGNPDDPINIDVHKIVRGTINSWQDRFLIKEDSLPAPGGCGIVEETTSP